MKEVNFNCPYCGQNLEAADGILGTAINCPTCKKLITVPKPPENIDPPKESLDLQPAHSEKVKPKKIRGGGVNSFALILSAIILSAGLMGSAIILSQARMRSALLLSQAIDNAVEVMKQRWNPHYGVR